MKKKILSLALLLIIALSISAQKKVPFHVADKFQAFGINSLPIGTIIFDESTLRYYKLGAVSNAATTIQTATLTNLNTLAQTLDAGFELNGGGKINANASAGGQLKLGSGSWEITDDNGGYSSAWAYGDNSYLEVGFGNYTWFEANANDAFIKNTHQGVFTEINRNLVSSTENVFSLGQYTLNNSNASIKVFKNSDVGNPFTLSAPFAAQSIAINSQGTFASGVNGTVAIGLSTGDVISDNSLYVEQIVFKDKGLSTGQLRLGTESLGGGIPANDWFQAYQSKGGTIALKSDIFNTNSELTANRNILGSYYVAFNAASMALGAISPETTAILDLTSTTKGFLPPRMTTVQRDAIGSPVEGLIVSNTTENYLDFYDGTTWRALREGINEYASIGFADSSFVLSLTQNVPVQITNPANTLFSDGVQELAVLAGDSIQVIRGGNYMVDWDLSYKGSNSDEIHIYVAVNGVIVSGFGETNREMTNNKIGTSGAHTIISLTANDWVSLYIENVNATGNVTFNAGNVIIEKL